MLKFQNHRSRARKEGIHISRPSPSSRSPSEGAYDPVCLLEDIQRKLSNKHMVEFIPKLFNFFLYTNEAHRTSIISRHPNAQPSQLLALKTP